MKLPLRCEYTFVLNFGYAEDASMSFMPWTSKAKFNDAKDALLDLAAFLQGKYLEKESNKLRSCCLKAKLAKDNDFCPKCGSSVKEVDFEPEEFEQWLKDMGMTSTDEFHGDYIEWDDDAFWEAGDLEDSPNPRFVYQAERVLAAAVGESTDPRVNIEKIFAARMKEKKNSFSFW